jgi:hypothetical protein
MSFFDFFCGTKRRYAKRLPPGLVRRAMLSIRVNEHTRRVVFALAEERGMSISEYVARLLSDHLGHVARTRGGLPQPSMGQGTFP